MKLCHLVFVVIVIMAVLQLGSGHSCECKKFINSGGWGNCVKKDNGRAMCYVKDPSSSGCTDLKSSTTDPKEKWSYEACTLMKPAAKECKDISSRCAANKHRCGFSSFVRRRCQKTCKECADVPAMGTQCKDISPLCWKYATTFACANNAFILRRCQKSCYACTEVPMKPTVVPTKPVPTKPVPTKPVPTKPVPTKPVATKPAPKPTVPAPKSEYFLSGENRLCSDTKDIAVNNLATCKVAAGELMLGGSSLAKEMMINEVNEANFAEGCYLSNTRDKGYFNKHCVDPLAKCKPSGGSAKLENLKFSFQICLPRGSKTSSG